MTRQPAGASAVSSLPRLLAVPPWVAAHSRPVCAATPRTARILISWNDAPTGSGDFHPLTKAAMHLKASSGGPSTTTALVSVLL
jgi:hypothetical protein